MQSPLVKIFFFSLFICAVVFSCKKDTAITIAEEEIFTIPKGFPTISFPADNQFSKDRWALGKLLFYDKQLSKNNTVSCASCHQQNLAFSDNVALSLGDNNSIGVSNSPTLANVAYHPYFTRAGGVPTLEMQILIPIQEHNEFNTNMVEMVEKLNQNSTYRTMALNAYNRALDAFVITRALATFERSLLSGNSKFDDYYYKNNPNALNESEKNGLMLFNSTKTNCSSCHSGFNFTNYAFENNGLYTNYSDSGRMRFTKLPNDRAKFKVPTLRNIALTAPYMHDGSFATLEDVISHYNSGGKNHTSKSNLIKPLALSPQEQQDLISFLNTLTDNQFIKNKNFKE